MNANNRKSKILSSNSLELFKYIAQESKEIRVEIKLKKIKCANRIKNSGAKASFLQVKSTDEASHTTANNSNNRII